MTFLTFKSFWLRLLICQGKLSTAENLPLLLNVHQLIPMEFLVSLSCFEWRKWSDVARGRHLSNSCSSFDARQIIISTYLLFYATCLLSLRSIITGTEFEIHFSWSAFSLSVEVCLHVVSKINFCSFLSIYIINTVTHVFCEQKAFLLFLCPFSKLLTSPPPQCFLMMMINFFGLGLVACSIE
jgi:hypothetical protein